MKRTATAVWNGTGKEGKGNLTTQSGVLDTTSYSFAKRFGDEKGTNPEELISAALAGCYTMKLSFMLDGAGITAKEIKTTATYIMEKEGGVWKSKGIHLDVTATIPGAGESSFKEIAVQAKSECPISQILNLSITIESRLIG